MEHIPYESGLSPLTQVSMALEAAGRVVLQVCLIGSCVAIALIVALLVADFIKSRKRGVADAKNADADTDISRGGCS